MLNRAIKNKWMQLFIFLYIGLMLVFYPISRMYKNEYATVPIQFEFACLMVIIGAICNSGLFLSLSKWGIEHKKITCLGLLFTALMNDILLLATFGNPFSLIENDYWNTVRYLGLVIILIISLIISVLVGVYQDEN